MASTSSRQSTLALSCRSGMAFQYRAAIEWCYMQHTLPPLSEEASARLIRISLHLTMQVVHLVAMNYSHIAARAASATLQGMSNSAPMMPRGKRTGAGQANAAHRPHTGTHGQSDASLARYTLFKHGSEVGHLCAVQKERHRFCVTGVLVASHTCHPCVRACVRVCVCGCVQAPVLTSVLHAVLLLGLSSRPFTQIKIYTVKMYWQTPKL